MKKVVLFLMIFLLINIITGTEIELNYRFNEPQTQRVEGTDYFRIIFANAQERGEIGEPALPWLAVKVLLPPGEIASGVEVILSGEKIMKPRGYLYPVQAVLPVSEMGDSDFVFKKEVYLLNAALPQQNHGTIKTEGWHGYNIALSSFCPVTYNPVEETVRYYTKAKIRIITQPGVINRPNKTVSNLTPENAEMVADYVQNADLMRLYPQQTSRDGEYDLLVICSEEFYNTLEGLKDFYHLYGRRVKFTTTEFIESNIAGIDLAEQIRNHIIDEYTSYGISSVLLAGDVEMIPARGFWCLAISTEIYEDDNIPADLYYSALDGSWDDDGDGIWGEPEEDDLLPEVAVARLPFSDEGDLANMINKTQIYSQNPVEIDLNKPLLIGERLWLDPVTWGADYMDLLVGYHEDNGYTTNGIPETDAITYLNDRDSGQWFMDDFLSLLNEGTSFIHHSGHSSYDYMVRMHDVDILESNFEQLNGVDHIYPLLYTHGCNCGGFDQEDCIAELALQLPNFLAGFVGNSRYGWFNEGQTEGPSEHLHREFVNALYDEKINDIARTHLYSKIATAPWVTAPGQHEEGALRWCFYDCNVLADAVLPIWTALPVGITVNYPNEINAGAASITIYVELMNNNEPAAGFRTALLYDNEIMGIVITDSLGVSDLEIDSLLIPGSNLTLAVSGYNCLPQQYFLSVSTSNNAEDDVPDNSTHLRNYPNPFNLETEITFYLEQPEKVVLSIYSIKGQHIITLVNRELDMGVQTIKWNGKDTTGKLVNSGIYFARLRLGESTEEIKMLLLK